MKWEVRHYWRRNAHSRAVLDEELSRPIEDIASDKAEDHMKFLEMFGYKRHEHNSQIFFDKTFDVNTVEEVIFYR